MTKLERHRTAAKLSQYDLARRASPYYRGARIAQSTVSKLEAGLIQAPSFDLLDALARALRARGQRVEASDLRPARTLLIKGNTVGKRRRRVVAALRV